MDPNSKERGRAPVAHSVVLANYNGVDFLEQAIRSVLAQEQVSFELILVDDGSSDGSLAIMQDFAARYPELVRVEVHAANKGQGAGFNTGVASARGTYVSFIDADDLWFPGKLRHVEQAFTAFPDAALHHHNLTLLRDGVLTDEKVVDSMALGHVGHWWKKRKAHPGMLPRFAPTAGLSMPRAVLQRLMPCPEVRVCADMWLTFGALAFGPVSASYEAHGAYRVHDGNNYYGRRMDIWAFLYDELLPTMRKRWVEQGVPDVAPAFANDTPAAAPTSDLLDLSPRKAWRWMARRLNAGRS